MGDTTMSKLSQRILQGAVISLGIPYALVIALNCFLGWPTSQPEEGRYQRALHPSRVLNLNCAIFEQVAIVRFLPLYIRWRIFYSRADTVTKDIPFGRNNNTLDVWQPSTDDDKSSSSDDADSSLRPVVVFVYGGAWGTGDKNMYGLLAQTLADRLGAVVCIPNYSIYPKGYVPDMLHDLEDTIAYIKSSDLIKRLRGDPDSIILSGHSAGGHLAALVAIDLAQRTQQQMKKPTSIESALATNTALDLLSSVRAVFCISGVFHVRDHYEFESWRGVEDVSAMWRAMEGLANFDKYSPLLRLGELDSEQIARLPPFLLIHGTADTTVPISASERFASSLARRNVPASLKIIPGGGHAPLVLDMMEEGRCLYDVMTTLVTEQVGIVFKKGRS